MNIMREVNLSGVDLNLLPALEALLRLRNVTHAAAAVGMSQPAMSRALGRLRHLLDDPLLVRASGGLALTPRARQLEAQLIPALAQLRGVFSPAAFDPRAIVRTVRIASTDNLTLMLAPHLMQRLSRDAPQIDLRMTSYPPDILSQMERGAIDFAFALSTTPLPPGAASMTIADDRLALVMRRGHPAARRRWTLADYGRHDHVSVSILDDGVSELDALLAANNVTRRIKLVTPQFYAALETVARTDLVTTLSRAFAERFREQLDLVLRDPPFETTALSMTLVWSRVHDADPLLAWLRGVIREAAQTAYPASPPSRRRANNA